MIRAAVATIATALLGVVVLSAGHAQEAVTVVIDADPAGNTATSVGTTQNCARISSGQKLDVDVTADSIPEWQDVNGDGTPNMGDSGGLLGFQFILFYDPKVVEVTAVNPQMIIAANGVTPIQLGDRPPDKDGKFQLGLSDFGSTKPEDGAGVLARITLSAVGNGQTTLNLNQPAIAAAGNQSYPLTIKNAAVAVGQSCTPPPPPPPPTPGTPDSTPGAQPSATPGGSPDSGTSVPTTGGTPGQDATSTATGGTATPGGPGANGQDGNGGPGAPGDDGASGPSTLGWVALGLVGSAAAITLGVGGWLIWRRRRLL